MRRPPSVNPLLSRLGLKILAIPVLFGALPTLLVGFYLLRRNEEILRTRVRDTLGSEVRRCGGGLNSWIEERQRDGARWAASFVVFEGVEALARGDASTTRVRGELTDYLESVMGHYRAYESLFVVDRGGRVLAATRPERLESWALKLPARQVTPGRAFLGPIRRSEILDRPTLLLLTPIQGPSAETIGHLVARIDLREIEVLLAAPRLELPVSFWMLDRNGRVVARDGMIPPHPGQERFEPVLQGPTEQGVQQGALPGRGAMLFTVATLKAPLGSQLVAVVPRAEALGPLARSRRQLMTFGFVVAAGTLLAFAWTARRVLRPILLLSAGARRLSAGDLNVYLPVRGRDEIAALTTAFNEMIRRLREGREEIDRTHDELARANEGLRSANEALETLAITDGLTGLYNHRHFQDTIERELRRCRREARALSLLMLDVDHFKAFNDRWGHPEGDKALRRVAGLIMKTIRASDSAFRYGGEELAVLLPGCAEAQAREVAEKMRVAVAAAPRGRPDAALTISVGVADFPDDAEDARGLIDAADSALYQAKARGRNCVRVAGSRR